MVTAFRGAGLTSCAPGLDLPRSTFGCPKRTQRRVTVDKKDANLLVVPKVGPQQSVTLSHLLQIFRSSLSRHD